MGTISMIVLGLIGFMSLLGIIQLFKDFGIKTATKIHFIYSMSVVLVMFISTIRNYSIWVSIIYFMIYLLVSLKYRRIL